MKLDHVTAVVDDASAAAAAMESLLGARPVATVSLPGMEIRSFRVGDSELHLNAPTGPGPVQDYHRRHGVGYHHLALQVDDLDRTLSELRPRGYDVLGSPVETSPGLREVFLDPSRTGGLLIQLVERRLQSSARYDLDDGEVSRLVAQAPPVR